MAEIGRLSAKQTRFLTALLTANSIVDAAKSARVGERTARRWLADAVFSATLVAARQEAFAEGLERLKLGVSRAVDTLEQSLTAESESVRLRAAQIWLEQAVDLHKMAEIESRFDELERLLKTAGLMRGL